MPTLRFLYLLPFLISLSACGGGPQPAPEKTIVSSDTAQAASRAREFLSSDESTRPCLRLPAEGQAPPASAGATFIDTSYLRDSLLTIAFHYSGCQKGSYRLYRQSPATQGKRSFPLALLLTVREAGRCEMILRDTSCIDLSHLPYRGPEVAISLNRGQVQHFYRP
ncbi:MAG: hypothetical protein RI842_04325 [Schleiferiaceae bacterium]|nr:hypothetical protein [Schleiferiaceae bacterium]